MEPTVRAAQAAVIKQVGLVQVTALLVGLLYVSGYYINSIFLRNYGIPSTELLKLEYIKIGFVFWLIVLGILLLPLGAYYLTSRVRSRSGLPNYWLGLIGNASNVIVMLGVPIGLSFMATNFEWDYVFEQPVFGFRVFRHAVMVALLISTILVVILPAIERAAKHAIGKSSIYRIVVVAIECVRFGGLAISVVLIVVSVSSIPWTSVVLNKAVYFLLVVLILGSGLVAAYFWVRHIERTKGSIVVVPLIGLGIAFFYYLAMASYVYGLYPAIPSNRGGKLPLTQVYVQAEGLDAVVKSTKVVNGLVLRGPIYIVEETDKVIHFADAEMASWFEEFVTLHSIRTDAVKYIRTERIADGFPKTRK